MKKLFVVLASLLLMIGVSSCTCSSKKAVEGNDNLREAATVENLISLDRQSMYANYAEDYRWFETGIQLVDFLDEENDGTIDMVVNVFQAVESRESGSFDTFVVKFQHVGEDVYEEQVHGFWVEDFPLNDEEIKVTFAEAYEKVMEVNLPKPHTRQVVLRKQIGPKPCNPQWIFGNLRAQIYVDAVTGEVTDVNPAFGPDLNLGTPLGEWP